MDSLRGLSGGQCFDGKFVNDIRPSNLDQLPCEYRRQAPRLCKSIDVMMKFMVHVYNYAGVLPADKRWCNL